MKTLPPRGGEQEEKARASVAVRTISDWLTLHPETMERVIFNVFKDGDRTLYEEELL